MSERWVNAVIEIRVPLDVSIHAENAEKLAAAEAVFDGCIELPDGSSAVVSWEDVEGGEPVATAEHVTPAKTGTQEPE